MALRRFWRRRDRDLDQFRRDDSVFDAPPRRQLYTWPGEEEFVPSRRSLPRPFVKSVDYEAERFEPLSAADALSVAAESFYEAPMQSSEPFRSVSVGHGAQHRTLTSLMRGYFSEKDRVCVDRAQRREVLFAAGVGGRRRSAPGPYKRSDKSERSC